MFVEPLQRMGLLTADLDPDTWEDEERRDAVWLHAADLWMRRTFVSGLDLSSLNPSPEDVRVAGSISECGLIYCVPYANARHALRVFLFTGDLLKWEEQNGSQLGSPDMYYDLAMKIGSAAASRWDLPQGNIEGFSKRQALLWSVQTLRVQRGGTFENVDEAVVAVANRFGLMPPEDEVRQLEVPDLY